MLGTTKLDMQPTAHPTSHNSIVRTEQIDVKQLWDDALVKIELSITPANFKTWFRDTHIISLEDGTLTVGVPSVFVRDWLQDKFQSMILKTLRELTPYVRSIEYAVLQRSDRRGETTKTQTINAALPLEDYYINKSDNLNPKYSFENFVVGPYNALAHAADDRLLCCAADERRQVGAHGHARLYAEVELLHGTPTTWVELDVVVHGSADGTHRVELTRLRGELAAFCARWQLIATPGRVRTIASLELAVALPRSLAVLSARSANTDAARLAFAATRRAAAARESQHREPSR